MNKLLQAGRIFFALGMLALGILSFIMQDFIVGRPPEWSAGFGGKTAWAFIAGTILIAGSVLVLIRKKAGMAALTIGILVLLSSFLFRHLPAMLSSTAEGALWTLNAFKTLALSGGAFIVALSFRKEESLGIPLRTPHTLLWISVIFLTYFLIICGFAHFKFDEFVISFIPAYIPFRSFWTYFCGVCLIAGGVGILIRPVRKLAALLSGIMVLGWFLLLHIPRFVANPEDPSDRMGLFESLAISGIMFVLASLYSEEE